MYHLKVVVVILMNLIPQMIAIHQQCYQGQLLLFYNYWCSIRKAWLRTKNILHKSGQISNRLSEQSFEKWIERHRKDTNPEIDKLNAAILDKKFAHAIKLLTLNHFHSHHDFQPKNSIFQGTFVLSYKEVIKKANLEFANHAY